MVASSPRGARSALAVLSLVTAVLLVTSCGGSDPGTSTDAQFVDCTKETRAKPYEPGTVVRSAAGQLDFTLIENRPGPPAANNPPGPWIKGQNGWRLHVQDTAGSAVAGLQIQAVPRMPDHNHGTSITPVTTDDGGGDYEVKPLYLYMGGFWQVTLNIHSANADAGLTADSAVFGVCIPN